MYVDGVPYTSGFGFDTILQDIERIEVLKGPQGTLYGKNAEAGVVNVITRKPDNTFRGTVSGEIGEDGKMVASTGIGGPIIKDKVYLGISAKHYQKDGYIDDTTTGDTANDQEYQFGKINLRLTPTDNLESSFLAHTIQYDNGNLNMNNVTADDPRKIASDLNGNYYDKPSSTIDGLTATYMYNNIKFETVFTYWNYLSLHQEPV